MVPTYSGVANAAWGFVGGWGSNPMTAQDDVIVGGAVTGGVAAPARLGKGSDGQVLTVDPTTHHLLWANNAAAERGSSFPAQPAYGNNVPFFRTDLGEWYYYDGTRWLSTTPYNLQFMLNNAMFNPDTPGAGVAANGEIGWVPLDRASADIYIVGFRWNALVYTTNDAGNYWGIYVNWRTAVAAPTQLSMVGTGAATVGQMTLLTDTLNAPLNQSTARYIQAYVMKSGSPGVLFANGEMVYRKIAT